METSVLVSRAFIVLFSAQAALMDLKSWRISNKWLGLWAASGFVSEFLFFAGGNTYDKLTGMLIPVFILWLFFVLRLIGAGDVKLFSVLGIWLGTEGVLFCMLYAFAAGAVTSLMLFIADKSLKNIRIHVAVLAFTGVLLTFM